MRRKFQINIKIFYGGIIVIFFGFTNNTNKLLVKAQQDDLKIKIFPSSVSGDWQNLQSVFSQDLGEDASFKEFNSKNSAYPFVLENENKNLETPNDAQLKIQKIIGFFKQIQYFFKFSLARAEETTTIETASENTFKITSTSVSTSGLTQKFIPESILEQTINSQRESSSESIVPIKSTSTSSSMPESVLELDQENPVIESKEKTLELSNFSLSEDFKDKIINNIQLRFSLAGKGEKEDKLIIDFYRLAKSIDNRKLNFNLRFRVFRKKFFFVGLVGFEPTTFCSQSRRAKPLRHSPNLNILSNF